MMCSNIITSAVQHELALQMYFEFSTSDKLDFRISLKECVQYFIFGGIPTNAQLPQ